MNDYISKPLDSGKFLDVVSRWIATGGDSAPIAARAPVEAGDRPIIDHSALDGLRRSLSEEKFRELTGVYIDGAIASLGKIDAQVDAGDLPALAREAHALKGMSGNFGARRLEILMARLEGDCRGGDRRAAGETVRQAQAVFTQTRALMLERLAPV